jgi:capsular exopolysaccharide synthesis family protein
MTADARSPLLFYHRAVGALTKWWWIVIICVAACLTIASLVLRRQPTIYEARASVVIDSATPQVLGGQFRDVVDIEMGSWWSAREYIQTQYNVIRSESLAEQVAQRLDSEGNLGVMGMGEGPTARRAAVPAIMSSIEVDPVKDSRIVNIVVRYTRPQAAAAIANAVAESYIGQNLERRLAATRGTATWLGDQLVDLKSQLEHSEMALYDFKRQNNVLSVSLEDSRNILSNEIQRLSEAATTAKTKRIQLVARKKVLSVIMTGDPLNDATPSEGNSDTIGKLKQLYIDETIKLIDLKGRYLEKHPTVVAQKVRLDTILQDLRRESGLAEKALDTELKLAEETERSLGAALEAAKQEALSINRKQIEYDRLKRNADNNAKLYDLVLGRLKESDLAGQLRTNNIRLLDRAKIPTASVSPHVKATLGTAAALGILLGFGLVFLLDFLDNTVKSPEDLEALLRVPFLGLVPETAEAGDPNLHGFHILQHPRSALAECCRAIRTNVLFSSPEREIHTLLVTSSGSQEGKSTVSINMSITMALGGNRVILVDTDLRRPRLHKAFKLASDVGLSTAIVGQASLEAIIRPTDVPNLSVIPCGPLPPNPAELLHTTRFKELLGQLHERFDLVVFDSPPLITVTDAAVLSTYADGVLMVARASNTTREMLKHARRQLADVNARMLGCVMNRIDLRRRQYGYNGAYYYGSQYSYYGESDAPTS